MVEKCKTGYHTSFYLACTDHFDEVNGNVTKQGGRIFFFGTSSLNSLS
jgi:hypothetical protein